MNYGIDTAGNFSENLRIAYNSLISPMLVHISPRLGFSLAQPVSCKRIQLLGATEPTRGVLNQSQCGMYILRTAIRSQGSRLDRRGGFQTRPYQWTARAPANPPAMKRNLA